MRCVSIFFLSALCICFAACEQGACYFTCCSGPDNCHVNCQIEINSEEECGSTAETICADSEWKDVKQTEWKQIYPAVCSQCSDVGCAPPWWTQESYKDNVDSDSADKDAGDDAGDDAGGK